MHITSYGLNSRENIRQLESLLVSRNSTRLSTQDSMMNSSTLGSSLSCLLFEREGKRLLVLLDVDDGSGGTPFDCKMVWPALNQIQRKYRPHDMIILKSQVHPNPEYNQFYPFKEDVYPIGVFSDYPESVFKKIPIFESSQEERDIDVFFVGGYKFSNCRPFVWPKNRDIRKWWAGSSISGYEKLKEIRDRRPDIKFALFDGNLPQDEFFNLMKRSKICVVLPGIGLSARKFYEYTVFGKCILALKQQLCLWPCEEEVHYSSMGEDVAYDSLETKIDYLLQNPDRIKALEDNAKSIREKLKLDFIVEEIEKIISRKINEIEDYKIQY